MTAGETALLRVTNTEAADGLAEDYRRPNQDGDAGMELHEMTPSPVHDIGLEELFFLRGTPVTPLEPRAYDYFAPPEFDPQHSCCHGSQRAVDAWRLVGVSVVVCTLIVFWSAVAALLTWIAR